jgi:hypothetical protein
MAIGMGECREKVRAQMVEVWSTSRLGLKMMHSDIGLVLIGLIENDTASWEAAGGTGLRAGLKCFGDSRPGDELRM